ncbi:hypothetical protein [Neorhizobium alkalisoli]|uniref:Uncharacterized protein n=1 Tax=Neorhizobium alkalisoli TaxID=528178 RepID=A0A561QWR3_9HYPH|nr:hypothetical protein [Neorhizobium alkalisoli]TWF54821.1 hypothetical protein FHW37_103692 [Neorhizobium alkalisoli]
MLALFSTTIALLLLADLIVCVVARMSRIRQQIYDEQYCLNEIALIEAGMKEAVIVPAQPMTAVRPAAAGGYSAAA